MVLIARRLSILLFLALYFASSMVATQYKVLRTARRVFHAALQGVDVRIGDWYPASEEHHPRYREAKKAAIEFDFRTAPAIDLAPPVTHFEFGVFLLCWETHHFFSSPSTRAPP